MAAPLPACETPTAAVSGLPGTFATPIVTSGHTIALWEGGTVIELATALASQGATSATYFRDGMAVVLVVGAPSFVNAAFRTIFPGDMVARSTLIIVSKR